MSELRKPSTKKTKKLNSKIDYPAYYNIIICADNITYPDFIKAILRFIYYKTEAETNIILQQLYIKGKAIVGSYVKEIAVTKQNLTQRKAIKNNFPLSCLIEINKTKT